MVNVHDGNLFLMCTFKFFIYDHKHDNYLVVQNIHEKSFHSLKNEWEISRVLKLSTFTDASQGFLKDDCCIFGVEISVIHFGITKTAASLSLKDISNQSSYTWKIDKFSELTSESMDSPVFTIGGYTWNLCICPKGESRQQGKYLSLFLELSNGLQLFGGKKLLVEYELRLKDQHKKPRDDKKSVSGSWFCSSIQAWGFSAFITVDQLHSPSSRFVRDDSLIVKVKMISMSVLSDTKPLSGK